MAQHFIVMGDVVGSSRLVAEVVQAELGALVSGCNVRLGDAVLSPLTITLGDEFQGVVASLRAAVDALFCIEEARLRGGCTVELRYVVHYGEIATPLNREVAHGMIGPGLARARSLLTSGSAALGSPSPPRTGPARHLAEDRSLIPARGRGRPQFTFDLPDERLSANLMRLCQVVSSTTGVWKPADYPLIADMLADTDNEAVAGKHEKNRTQVWKRRKHLFVEEYRLLKAVVYDLVSSPT